MRRGWVVAVGVGVVAAAVGYLAGNHTRGGDLAEPAADAPRLHVAAWLQDWPDDAPGTVTLHVTPGGSSSGECSVDVPCSLTAARDRARSLAPTTDADLVVSLAGGDYVLDEPFVLTSADGGRNGHRVVYRAARGSTPVIDGGRRVVGWRPAADAPGVYVADVAPGTATRQVYVDGKRATRARGPMRPAGWARTANGFRAPDDRMSSWRHPDDLEVVSYAEWRAFRCPVSAVDGRDVTISPPCWHNATAAERFAMNDVTWIENAPELLDEPGEWYLDHGANRISYRPRDGEDLTRASVTLAAQESLFELHGSPDDPIHDVGVEGLTFAYSTWNQPSTTGGYASTQAGWHRLADAGPDPLDVARTPGAVRVDHARHVRFTRNTFEHLGGVGLDLLPGAQDVGVVGNRFTDVSSTAIQIGDGHEGAQNPAPADQLDRLQVADNFVDHVAVEYEDAVGIFVSYASNTSILHNELQHLPYSGISMGWGWGTDSYARNNLVFANRISDVVTTLQDGGAIYTLSPMPGTVIERNHIADQRNRSGALFLDEGTADVTVADNVIERSPRWLHIWAPSIHDNTVVDNAADTDAMTNDGVRNTVVRNHTDRSSWPASAQQVVDEAGLEAAYVDLRDAR